MNSSDIPTKCPSRDGRYGFPEHPEYQIDSQFKAGARDLPVYTVDEQKSTGSATELLCLSNIFRSDLYAPSCCVNR